ncbi:MAG TPA: methyltransferase domain-containing protein [Candidatus Binataceae bacterium]|jgi:ubiquinone/menaquinone biosynthesis C-methylase UbiE|nr:methyltransferase domain-containing protein [Candidatus Binataceae bacterium]
MPDSNPAQPSNPQRLVDCYFRAEAPVWEQIYRGTGVLEVIHQQRLRIILDLAQRYTQPESTRVLDAGCGAGPAAIALAGRNYNVHAVDPVLEMVELTRQGAARQGVQSRVKCALGDVNNLAFADESFDLVIAAGVLPWLPSPDTALKEMCRVLKPGGCLILSTDNRWGLCWFLDPLTNPLLKPIKDSLQSVLWRLGAATPRVRAQMTPIGESQKLLRANALRILEGTTLGFGPLSIFRYDLLPRPVGLRLDRMLQALADRNYPLLRRAGAQYVVAARKPAPSETLKSGPYSAARG